MDTRTRRRNHEEWIDFVERDFDAIKVSIGNPEKKESRRKV